MLAIERLKRLPGGSGRRHSGMEHTKSAIEALEPASSFPTPHWLTDSGGGTLATPPTIPSQGPPPRHYSHQLMIGSERSSSGDNIPALTSTSSPLSQQQVGGVEMSTFYAQDDTGRVALYHIGSRFKYFFDIFS